MKSLIVALMASFMVLALASCGGAPDSANAPEAPKEPEKRAEPAEAPAAGEAAAEVPEDETLKLTV
ncbi:MAG: hypothetical protein M3Q60_06700, partial [Actinomycetota bacterium]|nr:hypothetical protein [Actinomycetota bacterium]